RRTGKVAVMAARGADAIMMEDAGAKEATEEEMLGALDAAHHALKQIVAAIDDLKQEVGRSKKSGPAKEIDAAFRSTVEEKAYGPLADAMRLKDRLENYGQGDAVLAELLAGYPETETEQRSAANTVFKGIKERVMRDA